MPQNPIYKNPYRHPEDTGLHIIGREINLGEAGLATGAFPIGAFEKNAIPLRSGVTIITAFNAATTNVLEVGTTAVPAGLITGTNSASGTVGANKQGTGTLLGSPLAADTVFMAKFTQSGAAATTGKAIAWVEAYVPRTPDPRTKSGT